MPVISRLLQSAAGHEAERGPGMWETLIVVNDLEACRVISLQGGGLKMRAR